MPGEAPFASSMEILSHLAKLRAAETCRMSSAFPQPGLLLAGSQDVGCSLSTDRYCPRAWWVEPSPPIPGGIPPGPKKGPGPGAWTWHIHPKFLRRLVCPRTSSRCWDLEIQEGTCRVDGGRSLWCFKS